ncbi:MAG TPA: branched-chain amino acid ABC transporter ATP-binding protein/permease [Alphaproteobacteria bacterium]|nr:branched-chain amino acid ABC transporter ATP-binding protein/permease [Alphaproteobacteria bacterium]
MIARALRDVDFQLALGAAALAFYALAFASPYGVHVLEIAGIYALLALGYQFIFGYAGALSLAQGAFMGLGAYVSGILAVRYGIGFEASLPASVAAPMLLASLVAVPVLRLETHYFALATLIVAQIVLLIAIQWVSVTGGANGLAGVDGLALLGRPLDPGWPSLVLVWATVALGALLSRQFARGAGGQAFALARHDPAAAASIGLDVGRLRFAAFLASGAYAGLAGAFYVHTIQVVAPDTLELPAMVTCLTIAVVGGRCRVAGAIAAALLVIELPEWFRALDAYRLIGYGAMLLVVIVLAPDGLVAAWERLLARLWPATRAMPARPAPLPMPRPRAAAAARTPLLEIESVSKRFGGIQALDGVSLAVAEGERLGLIGPNGSGKTTLVNLVSGIYRPDAGRILFAARDLAGTTQDARARVGIARTFQNASLVGELSALDNVAVARGARDFGLVAALATGRRDLRLERARGEAMALLDAMGAGSVALVPTSALAYGDRRRVELARALAAEPRLLLLDEPAAGLSEAEQADLARRLKAAIEGSITLVAIEHNIPFLASLVDRLACLDEGKLIAQGTPAEMRRDARVIEAYLGTAEAVAS